MADLQQCSWKLFIFWCRAAPILPSTYIPHTISSICVVQYNIIISQHVFRKDHFDFFMSRFIFYTFSPMYYQPQRSPPIMHSTTQSSPSNERGSLFIRWTVIFRNLKVFIIYTSYSEFSQNFLGEHFFHDTTHSGVRV